MGLYDSVMTESPLIKAINICGGQVTMAAKIVAWFLSRGELCRVKQGHVWNWINKQNGMVPSEYAIPIADSTGWKVTPHELRPDIYPHPTDGLPEHMRQAA